MSEDTGSMNKLSGIWMQIDAILHRQKRTNVWENRGEYVKVAPKKKEKLKLRSKALIMCHPHLPHLTGVNAFLLSKDERPLSSLQQSPNRRKSRHHDKLKTDYKVGEMKDWETGYIHPTIECSFNLTRVSAQLERLMGTNVVRLTDRKYMMELRQRINEDFNEMLAKRIETREVKEMERQRNLFMEGKITQCSEDYNNHPIFIVNQAAEPPTVKRRSKLKTNRQKNAERLIRQGAKWEKERQKISEIEKQRELEEKARQEEALNMVNDFQAGGKDRGMKLPRLRNSVADSELALKDLSDDDNCKSASQSGKSKAKERRTNSSLRSQDSERNSKQNLRTGGTTDDEDDLNHNEADGNNEEQTAQSHGGRSHRSQMTGKVDTDNFQYEDPMVSELKQTESVKDMYKLANEILCGKVNTNSTITEESSEGEEEEEDEVSDTLS